MEEIVIALLIIATVTVCEARRKPKIEVFEIRGNGQDSDVSLQVAQPKVDDENKESNLKDLLYRKEQNTVNKLSNDLVNKLQRKNEDLKEPIILILTPNNNAVDGLLKNIAQASVDGDRDHTRAAARDLIANLLAQNPKKSKKAPLGLRSEFVSDRTSAPRHRYLYDRE